MKTARRIAAIGPFVAGRGPSGLTSRTPHRSHSHAVTPVQEIVTMTRRCSRVLPGNGAYLAGWDPTR